MATTRFWSGTPSKSAHKKTQQPYHEIQSLTSTKTTATHNRVAFFISILLLIISFVVYPNASSPGLISPASSVIFSILIIFTALMTSYLLFGQFLGTRLPSLAILGGVYLYVSLINIPYLLTLPGIFAPSGFFNAGAYAPNWLWVFWQVGYPLGIILYGLIDKHYRTKQLSPHAANKLFLLIVTIIPLLAVFLSFIAIDHYQVLPNILMDNPPPIFIPVIDILIIGLNGLMCIGILFLLRSHNVLYLWLRVSALASFINVSSTIFTHGRYTIGWYVSRTDGLLAAIFILCALLYEVNRLYTRLAGQNEELARQNRIQGDFLATIGHEFRTALTAIQGFSEMMREGGDMDAQDVQEYANDIHTDATRLTRLINNLLDLERMKSGHIEMHWGQVEINSLIQEIVNRTNATAHACHVQTNLDPHVPTITADSDMLTQTITNLINNALKYSPDGGTILITNKQEGNTLHILIQDPGIGIPAEKLEQIFERYARVESSATHYIGGTGLGLSIVRQIVEMHHGNVWAESVLGQGSTFHIVLPIQLHITQTSSNQK